MKRRTSDEERTLFEQAFKEGRPIKIAIAAKTAKKKSAGGPSGVNGATQERLRKGQVEPDAKIDLHGMTEAVAHRALASWLTAAQGRGHRLALVVTGKGNPRNDENAPWMMTPHGILKQMVPRWLNEPELAALIARVQPAHVKTRRRRCFVRLSEEASVKQKTVTITVPTHGAGLYEFTDALQDFVRGFEDGLVTCFIRHTSASLVIQENADPDVQKDLRDFFAWLAKSGPRVRHTAEGPDDMPSHIRSALTQTSISIPLHKGGLALGTWQGIYVFEHRDAAHRRDVVLQVMGE